MVFFRRIRSLSLSLSYCPLNTVFGVLKKLPKRSIPSLVQNFFKQTNKHSPPSGNFASELNPTVAWLTFSDSAKVEAQNVCQKLLFPLNLRKTSSLFFFFFFKPLLEAKASLIIDIPLWSYFL